MAKKGQVFNSFKRQKLLRKHLPGVEALAGMLCMLALLVSGVWIAQRRDDFAPSERDVSIESLEANSVEDTLYKTPLQRWRDPALGPLGVSEALDVSPFPAGIVSTGWTPNGRVETFTPDTLYEKINGQAEQYLKFGFQRLDVLTLEHSAGAAMDLFLYDQGAFANCLGLYQEQRGDKPVERSGEVLFTPTALGAYGMVGKTFFHLIGTSEGEPVVSKTPQLLAQLGALAGAEPTPTPFLTLREALTVPLDRVAYTPVNVFQYGFAERFWFAAPEDDPAAQVWLHEAADEAAAQALLERLLAEQATEYEAEGAFWRHRFLKTYFSAARAGSFIYGVNDYPSPEAAEAALGRLETALGVGEPPADDEGDEPSYEGEEGEY
jgi:hypothetical protein